MLVLRDLILNFNPPAKKDCVKVILSDCTELKCSINHPIYKKINNLRKILLKET